MSAPAAAFEVSRSSGSLFPIASVDTRARRSQREVIGFTLRAHFRLSRSAVGCLTVIAIRRRPQLLKKTLTCADSLVRHAQQA
jgi:hypothetical protein